MHYAVCGGWFLPDGKFDKFDRLFSAVIRQHGFPTALTCGHMAGAERMAIQWGKTMLVSDLAVIDEVMPTQRALAFYERRPQVLIVFSSGSPANDVLRTFLSNRDVPSIEVAI